MWCSRTWSSIWRWFNAERRLRLVLIGSLSTCRVYACCWRTFEVDLLLNLLAHCCNPLFRRNCQSYWRNCSRMVFALVWGRLVVQLVGSQSTLNFRRKLHPLVFTFGVVSRCWRKTCCSTCLFAVATSLRLQKFTTGGIVVEQFLTNTNQNKNNINKHKNN